ncbi:MAG: ABC transporter substrate-binding protein, partial [Candidatus Bipolaricaulota bacterium]|nr:ABC transporter substrate-binding protein [Candidatus Bipolaricaulota bacterium]
MKTLVALVFLGLAAAAAPVRIVLDFYPNPNHVPLVVAEGRGLFREAGVEVELVVPSDPSAPAKLVALRGAELGLTPQLNYLLALDEGLPLLAVGALIDGGLGGLLALAESGIRDLRDLKGKKIGYA